MKMIPPTTIPGTVADLKDTAERLMKEARAAVARDNPDATIKAMLYSKSAGYLNGLAKWMEQDLKSPAAAGEPNLTISDT